MKTVTKNYKTGPIEYRMERSGIFCPHCGSDKVWNEVGEIPAEELAFVCGNCAWDFEYLPCGSDVEIAEQLRNERKKKS